MSRSTNDTDKQTWAEERRYYVGYDVEPVVVQKQSKYDRDVLSIPMTQAIVEDGDRDPRFDIDLEGS